MTHFLSSQGINLKSVAQTSSSKYGFINLIDFSGSIITRIFGNDKKTVEQIKLDIYSELKESEDDPRSFINTENDDLIRASFIGRVEHVINYGVAIYDIKNNLIHFCHEPINEWCEDIIGQIESYPHLPTEDWNTLPMEGDPEGFIEPINWDLTHFYGYRS